MATHLPRRWRFFDLDGTLVDSLGGIRATCRAACARHGFPEPSEETITPLIGLPLPQMIRRSLPEGTTDIAVAEVVVTYQATFDEIALPMTRAFADVAKALRAWRRAGVGIGVATGKNVTVARRVIAHCQLSTTIDLLVGGDEVARGKPAPDIVDLALTRAGARADNAVLVGDSVHDIAMAVAARVAPIGIAHGASTREALGTAGAIAVVDRFADLEAVFKRIEEPFRRE